MGRLQRPMEIATKQCWTENSGRLKETVRDWGGLQRPGEIQSKDREQ